jgi:hypothetical protein
MKIRLTLWLLLGAALLPAQSKQDYFWVMGYQTNFAGSGANGFSFDFRQQPMDIAYANPELGFDSNNASICDGEGGLLFCTNGQAVMNRHLQVMPNGDSINAGRWQELFWPNPFRGYPGAQDVLALPDPGYGQGYYLLHKARVYYPSIVDSTEIRASYVDMALDGGLGDVVYKNEYFYEGKDLLAGYLSAVRHANGQDWWVLQPALGDSLIYTFLVDDSGIAMAGAQNSFQFFNQFRSSASGTAKFSPDGTKYALYNYYDQLHIYDFDRETGALSNHQKIHVFPPEEIDIDQIRFSSVEWSPNSRFVYTATWLELHQVDTWADDPQSAVQLIDTYNGTQDPFPTTFFLMAQGPDCRIYMTSTSSAYSMHVINKPDELGTACDFVQNGIVLPHAHGSGLPNFPRFRVDEDEKCDPAISSVFGAPVYYRRPLEVFPNPSRGHFQVVLPEGFGRGRLSVLAPSGQRLLSRQVGPDGGTEAIDLSGLPSGTYFIELHPEDGRERVLYGQQVVKVD